MGEPYRVIVTGSHTWVHSADLYWALDDLLAEHGTMTVVHGTAWRGADHMAHLWAVSHQTYRDTVGLITEEAHPSDAEMVALGADACLAFLMPCALPSCPRPVPHGTHGTEHCAGLAEKAGIPVRRFTPDA